MRMSYWEYQGTAHTGVARIAASMKGVHCVTYSPVGDTYIIPMFTMMERMSSFPPITTSIMNGKTLSQGSNELPITLRRVYADHKPEMIVICCTCSSILLQEDLAQLARAARLPDDVEVLVYAPNPYRVQEDAAADGLLTKLIERCAIAPLPPTTKPSVNILGPSMLGFHNRHDLTSLERMLSAMGIEVNVVAPLGASRADLARLPQAWATIAPYAEVGQSGAKLLEATFGIPAVTQTPIGVLATREWVRAVLTALQTFARAQGLAFDAREPGLAAFALDNRYGSPSSLPWFTYSADMQSYSNKRVVVFGDYSHATAMARLCATEFDMQVVAAGTYDLARADDFMKAVAPYTKKTLATVEFETVKRVIEELQPDLVLGSQMERHICAGLDLSCAVISNPIHIEDFRLGYAPFLGYDGTNFVADLIYHSVKLGLEKHMIEMFGDAGLEKVEASLIGTGEGNVEKIEVVTRAQSDAVPERIVDEHLKGSASTANARNVEIQAVKMIKGDNAATATATDALVWSEEATKAMKGIPFFVRPKVQKRVEDYARERGYGLVTLDLVYEVREKATT